MWQPVFANEGRPLFPRFLLLAGNRLGYDFPAPFEQLDQRLGVFLSRFRRFARKPGSRVAPFPDSRGNGDELHQLKCNLIPVFRCVFRAIARGLCLFWRQLMLPWVVDLFFLQIVCR